jgi:hypothetical protein
MVKLAFLTVHGIGKTQPDYADELWRTLSGRLGPRADEVAFRPIYYQQLLQSNEQSVWDRMANADKLRYATLRKFLLFGFGDAAGLETGKEQPLSTYELAQVEVAKTLLSAFRDLGGAGPVVVVAHSLGAQVLSNYIYDAQRPPGQRARAGIWADIDEHAPMITGGPPLSAEEKAFLQGSSLRRLITIGCNIPIFVAAHQTMKIVPIDPPTPDFRWLNLYDPDDVLGWPLGPLSRDYERLVEDRAINAGHGLASLLLTSWNPLAHTNYWDDADLLNPLVAMVEEFV